MGSSSSSIIYSEPISNPNESIGETPIYRNPKYKDRIRSTFENHPELTTVQSIYLNSAKVYSSRPFLGTREVISDGKFGRYIFKTYEEVTKISQSIGSAIMHVGLAPKIKEYNDMELRFVGIWSKNREEYIELDIACVLYGITLVPIYETLGKDAVEFIFNQTNLTSIFVSNNFILRLIKDVKAGKCGKLTNIVSFEAPTNEELIAAKEAGIQLLHWSHLINMGKSNVKAYEKVSPDSIFTFSYTSGTTGTPKGVMLSYANVVAANASLQEKLDMIFRETDVHLSYLPLAHIFERGILWKLISEGSSLGFYNGDMLKLKEDLQELKPTILISVPRLYNRFYDAIMDGINKLTGFKKQLAERAIATKLYNLHKYAQYTHKVYDALIFNKIKQVFGGRVRFMITGSAPISEKVINFLKIAACCPIFELYGQTENPGLFITLASDPKSGHVGGPLSVVEFKLVDVPEMNYTSKDTNEHGELLPRGEICTRSSCLFKGYYKDPEKTAEAIDKDGWLHTGDIGQIQINGSLKIIDRRKNIFKLAIGEYIAAEKIENIYLRCRYIAEIFVYGDSLQHYIVAIAFPQQLALEALARELKIEGTFEELSKNEQVVNKVLEEMNKVGKNENLLSFELAKKLKLESISFGINNLLTPSFKLKRHDAKIYFKKTIDQMYSE